MKNLSFLKSRFKYTRYKLILFALLSLAVTRCSQEENANSKNVFGQDNRELIFRNEAPYGAIGQTDTKCTATIVGNKLALTAAHCVYDTLQNKVKSELKFFHPFSAEGETTKNPYSIKHLFFGTKAPEQERGKDWAILVFDKAVDATQQKMSVQTANFGSSLPFSLNLAGFSSDINSGKGLAVHKNCSIRSVVSERLLHDCDAKAGISGGPMFTLNGSVANIVAISVSEYRRGANDSVNRPEYSDEYANVAISANAFNATLQALASFDQSGDSLPEISNVQSLANPNYTEVANPPSPTPPPAPPPVSDYQTIAREILSAVISLGTQARNIDWIGEQNFRTELSRYAFVVGSYANSIEFAVYQFQKGSTTTSSFHREFRNYISEMENPANSMITEFQQCGSPCAIGNNNLLANVNQQLSTLRRLATINVP